MIYRFLAFVVGAALIASCAPISEEQCRGGNWQAIGFADGTKGRDASIVGTYAETCAEFGATPDLQAYTAGRQAGLLQYCTPANAYDLGRRGRRIAPVCTADSTLAMQPAHRTGLRYHEFETQIDEIEDRIRDREALLATNFSGTLTDAQEIEAAGIRVEIRDLERRVFVLRLKQRRVDSWP